MTDKSDKEGREPWAEPEPEPTAEERAEAEALRRALAGEEAGAGAPTDLEQLAQTAALLRAGGGLADAGAQQERLAQVRAELVASPQWSTRGQGRDGLSGWSRLWERVLSMGWPVWVPAGATAMVIVGIASINVPMLNRDTPAPLAMAEQAPARVAEPPVAVELEGTSMWEGLPRPPRELLTTQARVAAGEDAGLEALRSPMAEYRRRLYSALTSRYRRQADHGAAVMERMAAR